MEANSRELAKAGVPGSTALLFPLEEVIDSLSFTAPQLSQTAETQYQEYDRARSEADFRLAVVPPMIALAAVLPIQGSLWLLTAVVLASLILLFQAVGQERQSMDILANAAYLGYVSVPMVQSLTEYLSQLPARPTQDGEWAGAMIQGLWQRGYFEESEAMLYEVAELNEHDHFVAREYLKGHAPDLAEMWERLEERSAKGPKTTTAATPPSETSASPPPM